MLHSRQLELQQCHLITDVRLAATTLTTSIHPAALVAALTAALVPALAAALAIAVVATLTSFHAAARVAFAPNATT